MRRTCSLALAVTVGLTVPAAAQAAEPVGPAPVGEQQRTELEQQTRLDLSKQWRAYQARRKGEGFYQFVEHDFRRKRDIGRGLTVGGTSGMIVGVALFAIGIPQPDQPIPLTIAGYSLLAVGGVTTVVGAVLWGTFFRRMEKLEVAEYRGIALGPRGRVRLQSFTGTGLRLAF